MTDQDDGKLHKVEVVARPGWRVHGIILLRENHKHQVRGELKFCDNQIQDDIGRRNALRGLGRNPVLPLRNERRCTGKRKSPV